MKTTKTIKTFLRKVFCATMIAFFLTVNFAFAQIRPNINTLDVEPGLTTTQEQDKLACAIRDFLDSDHDFVELHLTPNIHTTANFYPWHRFFIGKVEEYLTSIGMEMYVPLPKWDPTTTVPAAFCTGPCRIITEPVLDDIGNVIHPVGTFVSNLNCGPCSDFLGAISPLCNQTSRDNLTNISQGPHGPVHGCIQPGTNFHQAPGNPWFFIWHAFVDDAWKQWECTCTGSPSEQISGADLWMKDLDHDQKVPMSNGLDVGYEPFPVTESLSTLPIYNSTDIWVRDGVDALGNPVNDGIANQVHENPDFSSLGIDNYVYVRVRNRGCQVSSGNEELKVYWARASSGLSWPTDFNNHMISGVLHGDIIGTQTITPLQPGEIRIYAFPWDPQNPTVFGDDAVNIGTHTCMLARIVNTSLPNDGMSFAETSDIANNTIQNNNIIWKNVFVFDNPGISNKTRFTFGNPCTKAIPINFAFTMPSEELKNKQIVEGNFTDGVTNIIDLGKEEPFTDFGMVTIDLGKDAYDKWVKGGKKGSNIEEGKFSHMSANGILHHHSLQHFPNAPSPYSVAVTGPDATLENLQFAANEKTDVQVQLNYRAQPAGDNKRKFKYIIAQEAATPTADCSGIGGIAFDIDRPECEIPNAGTDATIGKGCTTTLTASPIITGATYTWYDNNTGAFIGSGSSIEVTPSKTTSYELQMATPNGCVDFDIVTVNVDLNNNRIACQPTIFPPGCFREVEIFPNPVSDNQLHVKFVAESKTTVNISLSDMQGRVLVQDNVRVDQPGPVERILPLDRVPIGVYKAIIKCMDKSHTEIVTRM